MTEPARAAFWKLVDEIGWATKTTDYEKVRAELMSAFDVTMATQVNEVFSELQQQLADSIDRWERRSGRQLPVGDDSFSDLRAHIIGLGQKEFDAVIKNPELAMNRAAAHQFKESFGYCLPYPSDFE